MHEVGAVHAAAAGLLAAAGARRVAQVTVALGPGVDAEVAATAWRGATAGSAAAGADVTWIRRSDLLSCLSCAQEYPGSKLDRCPRCGGDGLVVEGAPEVEVQSWLPSEHRGGLQESARP